MPPTHIATRHSGMPHRPTRSAHGPLLVLLVHRRSGPGALRCLLPSASLPLNPPPPSAQPPTIIRQQPLLSTSTGCAYLAPTTASSLPHPLRSWPTVNTYTCRRHCCPPGHPPQPAPHATDQNTPHTSHLTPHQDTRHHHTRGLAPGAITHQGHHANVTRRPPPPSLPPPSCVPPPSPPVAFVSASSSSSMLSASSRCSCGQAGIKHRHQMLPPRNR